MFSTRAEADQVRGRPAASDPPAQQHPPQELRLSAGQEASAGEGAEASGGKHPGVHLKEAAGEEGGGEPPRGHQGNNPPPRYTFRFKTHQKNTPTHFLSPCRQDMTREQIGAEKVALQKALLHYESIQGRPVSPPPPL